MAYTQTQLTALERAIASGARTVAYDGKSVTYQSMSEMLKLADMIRRDLGLVQPGTRTRRTVAGFRRGFGA